MKEESGQEAESCQINYLNNLVEKDHRTIKRIVRPMMDFIFFRSATVGLHGIELMQIIQKGRMVPGDSQDMSVEVRFYSLVV